MTTAGVTAIVLAGGRSSRFGRDKLAETFGDRTVLAQAIAAVGQLARETIVVTTSGGTPAVPEGVVLVRDPRPYEGPLVGLLTGLRAATQPVVLLVGGDMPTMVGPVLGLLLAELADPMIEAARLEEDGRGRSLPGAFRREAALVAAERLVAGGDRSLRAVYGALVSALIAEATWGRLDPERRTLLDIDRPTDLG